MKPLLKNLMGNGAKEQETLEAMRAILAEVQAEREKFEALVEGSKAGADRLKKLGEPLAQTEGEVEALRGRMQEMQERFQAMVKLSDLFQNLEERADGLTKSTQWAESRLATALEGSQKIESSMAELVSKTELAADLKERLTSFLDVEKPFQLLRGDAENLRGTLEGAVERMARLREQHDRLLDANKMAMTKLEVMDRKRDELGRSLQDKERRVENVAEAVKSLDGVQNHLNDVKREMVTLKALGDSVAQKTAALEAHREALDRALAQTEHLDRAMRNIDAGMRQQKENEKSLAGLAEQVAALRSLHEAVIERSNEISQLQRQAQDTTVATRQELSRVSDEMKNTLERFEFEARGIESVSQRVADLRGELTTCENRFKSLNEASLSMGELKHQVQAVASQLLGLQQEVGQVDREMGKLQAMRRELDTTANTARELSEQVARIEAARGAVDNGLRDLSQLAGAHALVKDALEQMKLSQDEMNRVRTEQSATRQWLTDVVAGIADMKARAADLHILQPALDAVEKQARRIADSTATIEARREFVDELHKRMAELGALAARMDERGQSLQTRMDAAEQRFVLLGEQSQTAEQVANTVSDVTAKVTRASSEASELNRKLAQVQERCESVEALAAETRTLRGELEQRQHALAQAADDLAAASQLREEAANMAAKLQTLSHELHNSLGKADERVLEVDELSKQVEDRTHKLRQVESRLNDFETRMAKWDVTEQEISRALEQIASRQGTIESLQGDLERMFAMAEQTSAHVREITSVHQELEEGREMLQDVVGQLSQLRDTRATLEERKRQIGQAEERLSRADALMVELKSSLETLEGQKVLVDQAVEKAGSLQSLVRQAEAAIENLREQSRTTARVKGKGGKVVPFPTPESDEDGEARAA